MCSSEMKPRLRAEWAVSSGQELILASCCLVQFQQFAPVCLQLETKVGILCPCSLKIWVLALGVYPELFRGVKRTKNGKKVQLKISDSRNNL